MDINNTLLHVNPRLKKKALFLSSKQGKLIKYLYVLIYYKFNSYFLLSYLLL
jgi:hypothetical protein